MKTAVPGGEDRIGGRKQQCRREVQSIEASQLSLHRQRGGVLDEGLIDLDDGEGRPLFPEAPRGRSARRERQSTGDLEETDPTDEPVVGVVHRRADRVAIGLSDVALDERARIQVQVQCSASRSESTTADALRCPFSSRGALLARARDGSITRPSATSSRSGSSIAATPAGTMSANGLPRSVTRTCWPRATARSVSLNDCFNSRTPISRMWTC
jgi:hypothetical protein